MTIDINNFNYPVSKSSTTVAVAVPAVTAYYVTSSLMNKAVFSVLRLLDDVKDRNDGIKLVLEGLSKIGCDKQALDIGVKISQIVDVCLKNLDEQSINHIAGKAPVCATSAFACEIFKNFRRTVSGEVKQRIFFYDLIEGSFRGGFVGFSTGLAVSSMSPSGSKNLNVITAATGALLGSVSGVVGTVAGRVLGSLYNKCRAPQAPVQNRQ